MTTYTPDQIARAEAIADAKYPQEFPLELWVACRNGALAAIAATEAHVTERTVAHLEARWGHIVTPELRDALRNKEHLREPGA